MSMKHSSDTIWNRTRDLPTFSAVLQQTVPQRTPRSLVMTSNFQSRTDPLAFLITLDGYRKTTLHCYARNEVKESLFNCSLTKPMLTVLYASFWVIPRRLNFIYQLLRTPCLLHLHTYPPIKMDKSIPKRRHIKFRRRGITQKKAYSIQNMAKAWNQEQC